VWVSSEFHALLSPSTPYLLIQEDKQRKGKHMKHAQYYEIFSVLSLTLFLNTEGVTVSENQRIIFKSLLMSYFIIKQNKIGTK